MKSISEEYGLATAQDLRARMQGKVVSAEDAAYSDVRSIWNGAVTRQPALAPFALPGGYANFLTADDHGQVGSAYGSNSRRLREVKRQFDPDDVFSLAIPLPL
ncbi:MAG TPA: BBE domain-containing protein [Terriglobia bacterium]|nr:BBE domain-containing protein [Terriglobia bacterium]